MSAWRNDEVLCMYRLSLGSSPNSGPDESVRAAVFSGVYTG
jgi:hypothetical protein